MIIKTQLWNLRSVFVCVGVGGWGGGVGVRGVGWGGGWRGSERGGRVSFVLLGVFVSVICCLSVSTFFLFFTLVRFICLLMQLFYRWRFLLYLFTNAIILLWEISLLSFVLV